jgi:hypothetical protein
MPGSLLRGSSAMPKFRSWSPTAGPMRRSAPYVIADNQLALNAGWDRELLALELGELKLGGFDLALTGFGEVELGDPLADRTQGLTDPDRRMWTWR